jgi:hypothetical protein
MLEQVERGGKQPILRPCEITAPLRNQGDADPEVADGLSNAEVVVERSHELWQQSGTGFSAGLLENIERLP